MCICVYLYMYYIKIGVSIQESTLDNLLNGHQDQGFTVCVANPCQHTKSYLWIWTGKAMKSTNGNRSIKRWWLIFDIQSQHRVNGTSS